MMRLLSLLGVLILSAACVDSHATEVPPPDRSTLLYRIRFDYQSVIMAVGDTVRLHVVSSDLNGDTVTIPSEAVTWRSNNSAVQVDSLGRIIARIRTSSSVRIIGSWVLNDVERADTAIVRIVAARVDVGSVRVTPVDSGRKGVFESEGSTNILELVSLYNIRAWNSQGLPVSTITLDAKFSGLPGPIPLALVQSLGGGQYGVFVPNYVGELWVKTSALIFGTGYQDSAKFTAIYPSRVLIKIGVASATGVIVHSSAYSVLQPCGTVQFTNTTASPITIVFDRETAGIPCGGTLPASGPLALLPGQSARRVLSVMGAVQWRGQLTATSTDIPGLSGTLTVADAQ